MESKPLRQQFAAMRQSFFDECRRFWTDSSFNWSSYEDRDNPNFVEDVLTLYFRDSTTLLATVEQAMETIPIDFLKVDKILHQLKGSSASKTRELWQEGNLEGAKTAFQKLRKEHDTLKAKLETYFQQLKQAGSVETAMPPS